MSKINIKKIGVGIVGAGLIGWKRAAAIEIAKKGKLLAVADIDFSKSKELAKKYNCEAYKDWQVLLERKDIDIIIVSVPNNFSVPVAIAALKNGKHVLCEKPLGRNSKESFEILKVTRNCEKVLKIGFNHRFHASIAKAKKFCDEGKIGKVMFIRARYGYGGRFDIEKEWRMNKNIAGGGVLLDLGVHIIDLARWFGGEPKEVYGLTKTKFWKTKVDDNAFVLMTNKNVTTSFHVSSTNWKNIFSFEVFGELGFIEIKGKGGSYGEETLTLGKRKPRYGVPDTKVLKFQRDVSWLKEWENFLNVIFNKSKINGDVFDGYKANLLVDAIYGSSNNGKIIKL